MPNDKERKFDPYANDGVGVERVFDPREIGGSTLKGPHGQSERQASIRALLLKVRLGERYELEAVLGSGGFGDVYRARDLRAGMGKAPRAIKVIALAELPEGLLRDLTLRVKEREATLQAGISNPHLVPLIDLGEEPRMRVEGEPYPIIYLVTHLIDGAVTLDTFISQAGGRLEWAAIRDLFRDISSGVHALHEIGAMHRDLKPENILVDTRALGHPHGFAYILDFGSAKKGAKFLGPGGTARGTKPIALTRFETGIPLTPGWAAPEWRTPDTHDERFDVWQLAEILYYLICGRPPYEEEWDTEQRQGLLEEAVRQNEVPHLWRLRSETPPTLDDAVMRRGLAFSTNDRAREAGEFFRLVDPMLAELAAPKPKKVASDRLRPRAPTPPRGLPQYGSAARTPSRPVVPTTRPIPWGKIAVALAVIGGLLALGGGLFNLLGEFFGH